MAPGDTSREPRSGRCCGAVAHARQLSRPPTGITSGMRTRLRLVRRPGPPPRPPRRVGAAPERFRPASRSGGHRRCPPSPPTQARSPADRAGRPSEGAWPQPSTRARALGLTATCRAT
ncbi:hypothetical protein NN561_006346 [Cricetulus griseus]